MKVSRSIVMARDGVPTVVQIADPCNEYAVRFDAFLAVNDSTLKLNADGTLASLDANLDSTEAIGLVKELLGNIAPGVNGPLPGPRAVGERTQVYDFTRGPKGGLVMTPLIASPVVAATSPFVAPATTEEPRSSRNRSLDPVN